MAYPETVFLTRLVSMLCLPYFRIFFIIMHRTRNCGKLRQAIVVFDTLRRKKRLRDKHETRREEGTQEEGGGVVRRLWLRPAGRRAGGFGFPPCQRGSLRVRRTGPSVHLPWRRCGAVRQGGGEVAGRNPLTSGPFSFPDLR